MNAYQDTQPTRSSNGQIQFRKGHPILFITTRPFSLGQQGVQVPVGTEVLFDGSTAEIDGTDYTLPFLRGAVKAGWLVLADEYQEGDPNYARRTRADIQVRPVLGGNPLNPQPRAHIATTESDEREVGNTRAHAQRTASNNRGYVRGQTQVNGIAPGTLVRTQRGVMEVEEQDGVELDRSFMTTNTGERGKERLDLTSERASRAMHVAKNAQIQAGEGITEDDMLSRMTAEDREEYLSVKEAKRAQYVDDAPQKTKALPRPAARKVVARVESKRNGQSEGMKFNNSVGGGTRIGDETDGEIVGRIHAQEDQVETFEEGGIKFTGTNIGSRARPQQRVTDEEDAEPIRVTVAPVRQTPSAVAGPPVPANLDVRRKIAKAVCPDFPENYDFTLSPKKKLARLEADYSDRADVLQAVYAAEGDDMKALLIQEFPHAFEQQ